MKEASLKNVFSDPEFWFLIAINGILAYLYKTGQIQAFTIVWIYYAQSLLIGVQYFIRLLSLNKTTAGVESKGPSSPRGYAFFFLLHYGFFHFVYFIFLAVMTFSDAENIHVDRQYFLFAVSGFAVNTIFSLISQVRQDRDDHPAAGIILFIPYLRIIPMHLFIILGFGQQMSSSGSSFPFFNGLGSFGIFLILKTISDVLLYVVTNRTWKKTRPRVIGEWI
jgi:hypothetical protein